jgi:hypothetical protein
MRDEFLSRTLPRFLSFKYSPTPLPLDSYHLAIRETLSDVTPHQLSIRQTQPRTLALAEPIGFFRADFRMEMYR